MLQLNVAATGRAMFRHTLMLLPIFLRSSFFSFFFFFFWSFEVLPESWKHEILNVWSLALKWLSKVSCVAQTGSLWLKTLQACLKCKIHSLLGEFLHIKLFLLSSIQTFIARFRRTMDSSQNAYNEDTSAFVERLDCLEKALFRSGQSGLNGFQSWEKGQASQLTASSLVLNYRKRKITDVQP